VTAELVFVAVVAASHRHGLHRAAGAVLVVLYVVFVAVIVGWS
jgi:hypothetical protein